MNLQEALNELRKEEKRKFDQSIDLIINLKGIDLRKEQINMVINLPYKIKDKKVCGFLKNKSKIVKTITELEFGKYKEKKELKKLVKEHDYFIASAPLMPKVATTFGKVLGPAGKMPSPQLGILAEENEDTIKEMLEKISKSLKIRLKEPSIKVSAGKESMNDKQIVENIKAIFNFVLNALPKKKENIRKIMLKLTMTKPVKVEI